MIGADLIKAIGGGGATGAAVPLLVMYTQFTPSSDYMQHVAESQRGYILDVVAQAAAEPPGPFKQSLCRTLEEAIASLCADTGGADSICLDRGVYYERAGC